MIPAIIEKKLTFYYVISLFSLLIAIAGFSYNTWRLEVSEENTTIRTAAFEVFNHLAEFEQIIYTAHYDQNPTLGNPRLAWVKVGVIVDLSMLISSDTEQQAIDLKSLWQSTWQKVAGEEKAVDALIIEIDQLRTLIKNELAQLN